MNRTHSISVDVSTAQSSKSILGDFLTKIVFSDETAVWLLKKGVFRNRFRRFLSYVQLNTKNLKQNTKKKRIPEAMVLDKNDSGLG